MDNVDNIKMKYAIENYLRSNVDKVFFENIREEYIRNLLQCNSIKELSPIINQLENIATLSEKYLLYSCLVINGLYEKLVENKDNLGVISQYFNHIREQMRIKPDEPEENNSIPIEKQQQYTQQEMNALKFREDLAKNKEETANNLIDRTVVGHTQIKDEERAPEYRPRYPEGYEEEEEEDEEVDFTTGTDKVFKEVIKDTKDMSIDFSGEVELPYLDVEINNYQFPLFFVPLEEVELANRFKLTQKGREFFYTFPDLRPLENMAMFIKLAEKFGINKKSIPANYEMPDMIEYTLLNEALELKMF